MVLHYHKIMAMPIRTFLFASLIMTLYLCLHNFVLSELVERQTIDKEQQIESEGPPGAPGDVDVKVSVDTADPLSHIEEYFISFNIDCQEFGEHFEKMNFRLLYILYIFMQFPATDQAYLTWDMISKIWRCDAHAVNK